MPRWRPLALTISSGELFAPALKNASDAPDIPLDLLRRIERWRRNPEVVSAAELLETAIIHGKESEAKDAARLLARSRSGATELIREQAEHVLARVDPTAVDAKPPVIASDRSAWRARTRVNPRDALAWVELALNQVYSRQHTSAERSMKVALQLAPDNRHVLRSAVRLFHHIDETDRGLHLLRKSTATQSDPWLMAAEISLATRLGKPSKFMKAGLNLLSAGAYRPRQITELAGAAATTISLDGNRKRGKRLFAESMADPTGNSLAQAQWAESNFDEELISIGQLQRVWDANEARAIARYERGEFAEALPLVDEWTRDEPFSSRGYMLGAAVSSALNNPKQIQSFSETGLSYEPTSETFRNSLAFSLALQGRYDDALKILKEIRTDNAERSNALVAEANRGLIAFRQGEIQKGEEFYRKAISGFRQSQELYTVRNAQAYYAREAIRAGHPRGSELLAKAKRGLQPDMHRIAALVVGQAEALLAQQTTPQHPQPKQ